MKALLRLHQDFIRALSRLYQKGYQAFIKGLSRLYRGFIKTFNQQGFIKTLDYI